MFGGCCQWVLDVVCETVEWPYQPFGFDSLALRQVLGHRLTIIKRYVTIHLVSQTASVLGYP